MYRKILKDETDRVVFQYLDELKISACQGNLSIDEYLKDIDIDVEAYDSYEYYSLVINKHFNLTDNVASKEIDLNFKAFFSEFYKSVRQALADELKGEYKFKLGNAEEYIKSILHIRYKDIEQVIDNCELEDMELLLP